jgi:N-methylhydantoinase B
MAASRACARASGWCAPDGREEWLPAKCERVPVQAGDVLYFNTWGGGGWGDPLLRDPALVLADVERGLVSISGARRYGVVIDAQGAVDEAASAELRGQMRAARPPIQMFSRGGSIEEIKARALEETHLEPPRAPGSRRAAH